MNDKQKKSGSSDITSFYSVDKQHKQQQQRNKRKKIRQSTNDNNNNNDDKNSNASDKRARTKAERAAKRNVGKVSKVSVVSKQPSSVEPPKKKVKTTRTNHKDNPKFIACVEDYLSMSPDERLSKKNHVTVKHKLPISCVSTFEKYTHPDPSKRRTFDRGMGRPSNVSNQNAEFLVQHTIRNDRANTGLTKTDIIQNLQELQPEMAPDQAKNYIHRTFKKVAKGRLKPKAVKAQKTTSKRSQCSVAQQYRWFTNYEKGLRFLREKNTGVCRKTGKTFGELINHFVVGGDETCLMADADGIKIVGEVGRKKHERKGADFRGSLTMFRTGTPAGDNGPTAFIMKGIRSKYKDKFLIDNGCAEGSTIAMTENAFMTIESWENITPSVSAVCLCVYVYITCVSLFLISYSHTCSYIFITDCKRVPQVACGGGQSSMVDA